MTTYNHSLVIICPNNKKEQVNALAELLGWTGDNLSIPLSASGSAPATHWGCHAWSQTSAVAVFTGQITPEVDGYTAEEIDTLRSSLVVSVDNGQGREHFSAVLLDNNIKELSSE